MLYSVKRSVEKTDTWLVMCRDPVNETHVCVAIFTGHFLATDASIMAEEYAAWKNAQILELTT